MEARDGTKAYHLHTPPARPIARKAPIAEDWMRIKAAGKMKKLILRRYIVSVDREAVRVAIPMLVVPKTLIPPDIRLVLSLTECGVNPSVYVPSFALPTCDTLIKRVEAGDYMADMDVGEMFHNFMMHPTERMYHGLDIDNPILLNDPDLKGLVSAMMRFCRLDFGWRCAPYFACRMMMRAVELAKKHPENQKSAFAWSSVKLNLPGTDGYNPTKPWVMKLRVDGAKASDALFFVDDGRIIGSDASLCHWAARQLAAELQWLGNQDAARKRRMEDMHAGAWAGTVVYTDQGVARLFISQEKWTRAKVEMQWLWDLWVIKKARIPHKALCSTRGYMVYVAGIYTFLHPYLKGIHLTLESWRLGKNEEGWTVRPAATEAESHDEGEHSMFDIMDEEDWARVAVDKPELGLPIDGPVMDNKEDQLDGPADGLVTGVPRLEKDPKAILRFLKTDTPIQVMARPAATSICLAYGFGDASGEGFAT
jgi:hypothetical protein